MMKFVHTLVPDLAFKVEQEQERKAEKKKAATTIVLDGKTVRSTVKIQQYDSPLHIISAQICEIGITLAQKSVDGKTNEIPATQQLIRSLKIAGCMVVADAIPNRNGASNYRCKSRLSSECKE